MSHYLARESEMESLTRNFWDAYRHKWVKAKVGTDAARSPMVLINDPSWSGGGTLPPYAAMCVIPTGGRKGMMIAQHIAKLLNDNPIPDSVLSMHESPEDFSTIKG